MDTYSLGPFTVHRIGFGAMQLPGAGVFGPPRDHDEAVAVLGRGSRRAFSGLGRTTVRALRNSGGERLVSI